MSGCWPFFFRKKSAPKKQASFLIDTFDIKVGVIGPKNVGKTALITRYFGKQRDLSEEWYQKQIFLIEKDKADAMADKQINFRLTEMNDEQLQACRSNTMTTILICVDLNLLDVENQMSEYLRAGTAKSPNAKIILVGTKSDNVDDKAQAENQLKELQNKYKLDGNYFVNTTTGENISKLFEDIVDAAAPEAKLTEKQQRYWSKLKRIWNTTEGDELAKAQAILTDYAKSDAFIPSVKRLITFHWRHHAIAVIKANNESNTFDDLLSNLDGIKKTNTKDFNYHGDLATIIHFLHIKSEICFIPKIPQNVEHNLSAQPAL